MLRGLDQSLRAVKCVEKLCLTIVELPQDSKP